MAKGDDTEVEINMLNGIIKGLEEGLEKGRELDTLRSGAMRWWNQRRRKEFGFWLGRSLSTWCKLKGTKWKVVWCRSDSKYI